MNVDGPGLDIIPSTLGGDFEPAWSPDGKFIAFTSMRDGYMQIYLYNVDSKELKRMVETPELKHVRQPAWSPDGKKIIYAYRRVDAYELWTMSHTGLDHEKILASGSTLSNYQPVWSPDGNFILFNQQTTSDFQFPNLFSFTLDGEKLRQIYLGLPSIEDVDYSPDGIWIAYESGGGRSYHIYYSTPSGGGQSRITTEDEFEDFDPAWRPISK
jgi:TolB protein